MSKLLQVTRSMALGALVALAGGASQALTVYNTVADFNLATLSRGTDTFSDLIFQTVTASPLARLTSSGVSYSYVAAASTSSFFPGQNGTNVFLSPNISNDAIILSGFDAPVSALGGNFFGSDFDGHFFQGDLALKVVDASGEHIVPILGPQPNTFLGVVSDSNLVSVTVISVTPNGAGDDVWPSVDNLVLGVAVPVPEPETYALMLSGLAFVGFLARRRAGRSAG